MPELLWKAYIDFEVEEGERARARALYERLAASSGHWKVWVAYATFEAQPIQLPRDEREDDDEDEGDEENEPKMVEGDLELARQVFQKGYRDLKNKGLKNEVSRVIFLPEGKEHWSLKNLGCLSARRIVTNLEVLRGAAWLGRRYRQGGRHDACAGQAALRRRRDWAACGRYVLGSRLETSNTNASATRQTTTISLQMTSARRTRPHSSSFKWLTHGRPPGSPEVPAAVPAMLVMVAVAVAVHYQGSLRRVHRMIQTEIAGPNPTVVRTSPWTRMWRVWRAHRATHNWLDS